MTHTKQFLLVTFCDTTADIGASIWIHAWRRTADRGRTDRRGSQNSLQFECVPHNKLSYYRITNLTDFFSLVIIGHAVMENEYGTLT